MSRADRSYRESSSVSSIWINSSISVVICIAERRNRYHKAEASKLYYWEVSRISGSPRKSTGRYGNRMDHSARIHDRILAISNIAPRTLPGNTNRDILSPTSGRIARSSIANTTYKRRNRESAISTRTHRSEDPAHTSNESIAISRSAGSRTTNSTSLTSRNPNSPEAPYIMANSGAAYTHDSSIPSYARSSSGSSYKSSSSAGRNNTRNSEERRSKNRADMIVKIDPSIDSDIANRAEADALPSENSSYSIWEMSGKSPRTLRVAKKERIVPPKATNNTASANTRWTAIGNKARSRNAARRSNRSPIEMKARNRKIV